MSTLGIIPTYISSEKDAGLLVKCVDTFFKTTNDDDLLIIDDLSPNQDIARETIRELNKKYENLEVLWNEKNSGFGTTVNRGLKIALAEGKDAVLINADIEFTEIGWLDAFEEKSNEHDIQGALLTYPNGIIQHAGVYFSSISRNFDHRFKGAPSDLPAAQEGKNCPVTGALQWISHNALEEIGLYDEDFFLGYEDVDYCIRALEMSPDNCYYNPKVKAIHHESMFRSGRLAEEQRVSYSKLIQKHQDTNFADLGIPSMIGNI